MRAFVLSFVLCACTPPKNAAAPTLAWSKAAWMVGDEGIVLSPSEARTPAAALNAIASTDAFTAWAVGDGLIYYTTNGGQDWVPEDAPKAALYGVSFANPLHGVAVGAQGTIVETEDAGSHWQAADAPSDTRTLRAVKLSAWSGAGVAVGDDGRVDITRDGGRTWASFATANATLFAVDMNQDDIAVAVGADGACVRIDTSGLATLGLDERRAFYAVRFFPGGAQFFAAGTAGAVLSGSLDGGAEYSTSPTREDLLTVMVFQGGLIAAGSNGALVFAPSFETPFVVMPQVASKTIRGIAPVE